MGEQTSQRTEPLMDLVEEAQQSRQPGLAESYHNYLKTRREYEKAIRGRLDRTAAHSRPYGTAR